MAMHDAWAGKYSFIPIPNKSLGDQKVRILRLYKVQNFLTHRPSINNYHCRVGTYSGHTGRIIQLLSLGDVLLSLGDDRKLLVWSADTYSAPKVNSLCCYLYCQILLAWPDSNYCCQVVWECYIDGTGLQTQPHGILHLPLISAQAEHTRSKPCLHNLRIGKGIWHANRTDFCCHAMVCSLQLCLSC